VQLRFRLTLALALLAMVTSLLVAAGVRGGLVAEEKTRFNNRVKNSVGDVRDAIDRRISADSAALQRTCAADSIVDRAVLAAKIRADAEKLGPTDSDARLEVAAAQARAAVAAGGTLLATALGADEVWILDARDGFVLAGPRAARAAVGTRDPRRLRMSTERGAAVRRGDGVLLVARCAREERGEAVLVFSVRKMDRAFFDQLEKEVRGIRILLPGEKQPADEEVQTFRLQTSPSDEDGNTNPAPIELRVAVSGAALTTAIKNIDLVIVITTLISIALAAVVGFLVSRRLVAPLGALASQAAKVAEGTAEPVEVKGSDEVAALATAFNQMLEGLDSTRRRLHAAERVAAWREAARRIAHEVKNPLAPIRASIETLRRLRARDDPAFDGYFDEATTTVLQEVRRVASIVDEFSRYARIAPPRPSDVDPVEVAKHVVGLFASETAIPEEEGTSKTPDPTPRLMLEASPCGQLRADREQLVQVLVNLVKNALESTRAKDGKPAGHVRVEVEPAGPEAVRFVVRDDGPGVDEALLPRLFEPYASNKQGGTGLGLAIAQRIAVEHGGAIAYARGRTGGAIFRVILPRSGPAEPPPSTDMVTPRPRGLT